MSSHTSLAQVLSLVITISIVIHGAPSLTRFSLSTSTCFSLSFSFYLLYSELYSELDNPIVMESLCYSAYEESEDAYDVSTSLTGYEPNLLTFGELNDSSVPFSFMIPSLDQDMDDVTSASCSQKHTKDKPITANQKACQSASRRLLCSMDQGNLMEREMSINQLILVSKETCTVLTASFLKTPELRKWSMDQGNLISETARMHRLGLYLESRDRWLSRIFAKKLVITNSKQLMQKKSVDSYKDNNGDRNWNFVKFINKVSQKWNSFGNSRVLPSIRSQDESSSRTRTLFRNYQAECRNCKMKLIVWFILRIFRMLNQFAVEIPTLPVDQCHSHLIRYLKGCWGILPHRRAAMKGRQAFGTQHGTAGNVFANPFASSSAPYPQELNQWNSSIEDPLHTSTVEKSERQDQNQDLRCQSGPSAKNSLIFSGGDSSKNYGADQQRLQISHLHFDKFPTPATFACWKISFKTEVCTCSQFLTEAMQWIKEVELVDSVDEVRSSSSTRGISMPDFEVLDARIASALNKIIHNSHFKRKISLEEQKAQKQDSFLRGRQIAYLI